MTKYHEQIRSIFNSQIGNLYIKFVIGVKLFAPKIPINKNFVCLKTEISKQKIAMLTSFMKLLFYDSLDSLDTLFFIRDPTLG